MQLTVGFDFDLTLGDSRDGIAQVFDWVSEQTGVPIDGKAISSRLGPPLEVEMGRLFPASEVPAMVELYRSRYLEIAVPATTLMPGASEAIAAVRRLGGRVLVISAKNTPHTKAHIEHLGLDVDEVIGGAFGEQKGVVLREHDASVYVGDHLGDVVAAHTGNAVSVTVPTGGISAAELREAGSDVVLPSLEDFPAWLSSYALERRMADLEARLKELGSVVVAFSGGADSAFLLAAAVRALGPSNVVAATAISPSLPDSELLPAKEFAATLSVRHETPTTNELDREGYRANSGYRCYFCKSELIETLGPVASSLGIPHVATGTNADDARAGFRPGIRAASERGAVTPLLDSGFTKEQVRLASRQWGLPTWDKPAAACLSSRIAYGIQITPTRLARVEHAESALRAVLQAAEIPVRNMRIRDLGDSARVEVDAEYIQAVAALEEATEAVQAAGFDIVEVDPKGFRSGAMNELLTNPDRYR